MFNEEGKNERVKMFTLIGFARNKIININMKKT